jgi:hypothetical protein
MEEWQNAITIRCKLKWGLPFRSKVAFEPGLIAYDVKIRDQITGDMTTVSQYMLIKNRSLKFAAGQFYKQHVPQAYYYCHSVRDDEAELYMIENFQLGEIRTAVARGKRQDAIYYELIDNDATIARLKCRLERFKGSRGL